MTTDWMMRYHKTLNEWAANPKRQPLNWGIAWLASRDCAPGGASLDVVTAWHEVGSTIEPLGRLLIVIDGQEIALGERR